MIYKVLRKLVILFVIINVYSNALEVFQDFASNTDEIIFVLMASILLIKILTFSLKLSKSEKRIIACWVGIIFIGVLSGRITKYQSIKYVLLDAILFSKFIIVYLGVNQLYKNKDIITKDYKTLKFIAVIQTFLMVGLLIYNYFFNIFESTGIRYGYATQKLIFTHPTYLAAFAIFNISIFEWLNLKNKHLLILMNLILILATGRNKAIIFAVIYIIVSLFSRKIYKLNFKRLIIGGVITGGLILATFFKVIAERLLSEGVVRNMLYRYSITIAKEHFPLGSGFGTFASYVSGKYYSSLYYNYYISNVYGLTSGNYSYISDTFWPMVLGQLGFFGLLLFIFTMIVLFKEILAIKDPNCKKACIIIMIYLIVSSTSEAIFSTTIGVGLFAIISIFMNNQLNNEKQKLSSVAGDD